MRFIGSFGEALAQKECRHCMMQSPWSVVEPVLKAKLWQLAKSTASVFDAEPPTELIAVSFAPLAMHE